MYARRLRNGSRNWHSLFRQYNDIFTSNRQDVTRLHSTISNKTHSANESVIAKFRLPSVPLLGTRAIRLYSRRRVCVSLSARFYSSKGDGSNASGGKHVPVNDSVGFDKAKVGEAEAITFSKRSDDHAQLGEHDQQEWINNEKLSIDSRKRESPFLTKRTRFKNEFLRRVVPWDKITVSWKTFPYYIDEHTKNLLVECVASHLKHKNITSAYGARLTSSSGRILLRGIAGSELYRERLVKALAHDLQVPLLVLDGNVLAPNNFGQEMDTECESEEENGESGECTSGSEHEEEWSSSNELKSGESDDDDVPAAAKVLKKFVPCSFEEFAKRVSVEDENTSTPAPEEGVESSKEPKRPLKRGDRVKYVGDSVHIEVDNRIMLGKIQTSDGSTNSYTFISGRPVSNGQCGEVYEVNGDQVAVILDNIETKTDEESKDEKIKKQDAKPSIYWIDIQDIVHDSDTQEEDWYLAMRSLCEVLPSLHPIIVYIPDATQWLSRAVPKSARKEFIHKMEEMFDQLSGPIVLICGQNIQETGPKEREKYQTMLLPNLGRLAKLPAPLKQLTEGLLPTKSLKENDLCKLFTNTLFIHPPKEEELLRTFNKQIEDDRRIIVSRNNLVELHKVLEEHELSCMELLNLKADGVILTKHKAEKVVGWARSHHLSSCSLPLIHGDRLMIPRESLDVAILRLKEQETISIKPSQNLKTLAKDEYESNFISAVVPPDEIGVRFDDIGALEDVKRTLNELVSLPMKRPELFSHGNLLRPCKGILLFGPPGTGKTLLAKALATEAGANFLSITGSTLTSKWFGDAEKLTKALFSFASRLAPVIIFVDEVDSLLGARGGSFEHEATRRMRNEFMASWDGLRTNDSQRILIVGATNRPFDLDDAVIRRLPRRIYVDLPDAENRMKILKIILSQENLDPDFQFDVLANSTEGYSGSDLKNLCIAAAYRPVQELLEEENKGGVRGTTPSLRHLNLDDFIQAKSKVSASVAYDATSMNELRKWNDQYGEGGSRSKSPFGFGK